MVKSASVRFTGTVLMGVLCVSAEGGDWVMFDATAGIDMASGRCGVCFGMGSAVVFSSLSSSKANDTSAFRGVEVAFMEADVTEVLLKVDAARLEAGRCDGVCFGAGKAVVLSSLSSSNSNDTSAFRGVDVSPIDTGVVVVVAVIVVAVVSGAENSFECRANGFFAALLRPCGSDSCTALVLLCSWRVRAEWIVSLGGIFVFFAIAVVTGVEVLRRDAERGMSDRRNRLSRERDE